MPADQVTAAQSFKLLYGTKTNRLWRQRRRGVPKMGLPFQAENGLTDGATAYKVGRGCDDTHQSALCRLDELPPPFRAG
jgi:hypothetical protein